jgi:lipopolysaccharide/colanic/teichoic acid biosynthesis glycosyltransferase
MWEKERKTPCQPESFHSGTEKAELCQALPQLKFFPIYQTQTKRNRGFITKTRILSTMLGAKIPQFFRKMIRCRQSSIEAQKNFYTPEQFGQRLAVEKRRAERMNYGFAMIVLSLKPGLDKLVKLNGDIKNEINHIVKLICGELRETDFVSLRKDEIVSILLPDTDSAGAQCACQRLIGKLLTLYRPELRKNNLGLDDFEVEIISHPERTRDEYQEIQSDDTELKTERRKRKQPLPAPGVANAIDFRIHHFDSLNICVTKAVPLPIAFSLAEAFWGDQQLIQSFSWLGKRALKRAMDIVGAVIGLVLFSPLMLVIGLLIKVSSPGPILYKQVRLGYKGRPFTFLKFRSMYHNCDENLHQEYVKKLVQGRNHEINNGSEANPFYKIKNDPRITPVGNFIRKTSIDELPQFWNVLKGEMSLVGPRPAIPYEVEEYQNWHYRRIWEVKPGITGLWQVSGRSRTTFDEMVRLDIQYARNWSIGLDVKILFKTIRAVFLADGT